MITLRTLGWLITLALASLFFCTTSWATTPQMANRTISIVQRAYELQQHEKLNEAIQILKKAKPSKRYDKAYVNRMLGSLYWQANQTQSAIRSLTAAADSGALLQQEYHDTQRMLADILLTEGHYAQAETRYRTLITHYQQAKPLETLWLRMAQAQYQQQKWQQVEHAIKKQQQYSKKANFKPQVAPLNMLLGAQLAQKKWSSAISTTRMLRELEPKNHLWWQQLTTLYMYSNNQNRALTTLQQAQRAGFTLSQQEIKLMAQLYAHQKLPEKAAQTYLQLSQLDESIELLAQQATYWQSAKEWQKAKQSWARAAKLDAKYFWPLALLHLKTRDYQNAIDAINKLPFQSTEVRLTKIQALHALGENEQAFETAQQLHQQNPSDHSLSWVTFLSSL